MNNIDISTSNSPTVYVNTIAIFTTIFYFQHKNILQYEFHLTIIFTICAGPVMSCAYIPIICDLGPQKQSYV